MFRRNKLCGVGLICFGLGMLAAGFFESAFFCGCLGIGFLVCGFVLLQKK